MQQYGSEAKNTTVHWYIPWNGNQIHVWYYYGTPPKTWYYHSITPTQSGWTMFYWKDKYATVAVPLYDLVVRAGIYGH